MSGNKKDGRSWSDFSGLQRRTGGNYYRGFCGVES